MILVETYKSRSVTRHRVEIVERKGTGHPDFMCDALMESVSIALSREYIKSFGTILHHNIDKGLLAAGRTVIDFGGGELIKPMELIIGDRATFESGGKKIPVKKIAVDAARKWIRHNLRFVDPDIHVRYRTVLSPGSEELTDIFLRPDKVRVANDTSALIGYYPLSPTEEVVLGLEQYLNSKVFKEKYPETGEDIKVMGLRNGEDLDLTVAMSLISFFINSEDEYFMKKDIVLKAINKFLRRYKAFRNITVNLNTLDRKGRGLGGIYMTLLGTSADGADSGEVGRGNRVNGLISVNRPMGTEAAAGKNPVSHVGKIYNVLAHKTAEKICKQVDGVEEVYLLFLSTIGSPVDKPHMATAQVLLSKGARLKDVTRPITTLIENELSEISVFCDRLARGTYPIC